LQWLSTLPSYPWDVYKVVYYLTQYCHWDTLVWFLETVAPQVETVAPQETLPPQIDFQRWANNNQRFEHYHVRRWLAAHHGLTWSHDLNAWLRVVEDNVMALAACVCSDVSKLVLNYV